MPENIVLADTSCLIVLSKINKIDLLKTLYKSVYITNEIANEFGEKLPNWIVFITIKNIKIQKLLEASLDKGESSAIAYALENENILLILDDLKARKEAARLKLNYTGTLGILYKAKQKGIIKHLKPYVDKIENCGFRISEKIKSELLIKCKEI